MHLKPTAGCQISTLIFGFGGGGKQIIYFHVNWYIIWICQRFVKQNKVLRFPVHMKTSHQSTKKIKYRSSEKYSNTYCQNKQNITTVF
jgi:hypothetical protein